MTGILADDLRWVNIPALDLHTASNPWGSVCLVVMCRLAIDRREQV